MKRLQIPQKLLYEQFYVDEKILRTRNGRRKFIKNLLPEKRKENMQNKQPRFKSWLNNAGRIGLGFAEISKQSIRSDNSGCLTVLHVNHLDHNCKCPAVKNNN